MKESCLYIIIIFVMYMFYVNLMISDKKITNEIAKYITWDDFKYPGKSHSFFANKPVGGLTESENEIWNSLEICRLFYRKDSDEEKTFDYDVLPVNISRKEYLLNNGFTQLKFIDNQNTGTVMSIIKNNTKNEIYIVFRGTEQNLTDLKTDLDTGIPPFLKSKKSIVIHKGFIEAFESIKTQLLDYINNEATFNSNQTIIVTGHSLGAALATIFMSQLNQTKLINNYIKLITFGSPLVGNDAFIKSIGLDNKKNIRITNGIDIITVIPFSIFGYDHIQQNPMELSWDNKNLLLLGNLKVFATYIMTPPQILADHTPISYKMNLINTILTERPPKK